MSLSRIDAGELIGLRGQAAGIDLSSRRRVMTELAGDKVSGFRGRGMDFEEHRVYQPGDEARSIDWRVTARTGRPHVRVYREERERPVLLGVDLRPAMWFGTRGCFKAVLAARAAALCAWAAAANGDKVGGLSFGGGRHTEIRARGGASGVLRLLAALESHPVSGDESEHETDFAEALQRLSRLARPGSLVAVFSDFRGVGDPESGLFRRLARRAELVFGFVHDPLEADLPAAGAYPLARHGHAAPIVLDTGGTARRAAWRAVFERRRTTAQQLARAVAGHWLDLPTGAPARLSIDRAFGQRRTAA